jgi:hypothetical protein
MKGVAARIAHTSPICLALLVVMACGSRLEGKYGSKEALIELDFKSRNKANFEYVMMPTVEVDYEFNGKEIKIKTAQFGTIVGTVDDEGCLVFGGMYGTICKQDGSRSASTTAAKREVERDALTSMKSDLVNLVTAQEAYYGDHDGHYAATVSALGGDYYRASNGVTITIGAVSGKSWQATATRPSTSKKCVIAVGDGSSTDGQPSCQ